MLSPLPPLLVSYRNFLSLREEDLSAMSMMNERFSSICDGKIIYLVKSCNGVFFLDFELGDGKREFYIYNLTTGKYRFISLPDTIDESHLVLTMNLAFDPEKSEDYDVVCLWSYASGDQLRFSVYSSGSWIWRHSTECYGCNEYGEVDLYGYDGIFWNGAVHWFSQTGQLLCFDIGNCSFRSMSTTPIPEELGIGYFGEFGGHLHLIGHNSDQCTEFDIF
ncbi:hypothetical protein RND71_029513 [Anisodus tanguticus]|uniref:KIB1-4 beta-propeller domain-containing protein n=1 Tax=Anisodus tanguticus TaxID=243964 RepID=A0AAE1V7A4_9SOLA|nr:hypothetical protein RND71_029513 [Anisodus tanguticus]